MTLTFVYNADSGLMSGVFDSLHKMVSPETYECNLCKLTYGKFGMKKEWKEFIKGLGDVKFRHRDEVDVREDLPAIFREEKGRIKVLVSAEQINKCETIEDLKQLINKFK